VRARASGFSVLRRLLGRILARTPARIAVVVFGSARSRLHLTQQTTRERPFRDNNDLDFSERVMRDTRPAAAARWRVLRICHSGVRRRGCLKSLVETTYASMDNRCGRGAAPTAPGLADS